MLFLRAVAILLGAGVMVSAGLWVLTGERKWLGRAILLLKIGLAVGFVFFGVLLLERLAD
ncbi:MAG TPA: hypothetical protein VEA81_02880 [Burkholderiaceae bacterium]|nr:hypothetical protein [Burkholderiaceae bacterium]